MSLYFYTVCYIASLRFLNQGILLSWPATALPSMRSEYDEELNIDEESWIGSLASIGALLGTILSLVLTRYISARQSLLICCLGAVLGWVLIVSSSQVKHEN